jgi:hypothetical protein
MEAARTSETLVNFYQTTRRYNPEDSYLRKEVCLFVCLFVVYLTTLFQYLRQNSVDVGGKPTASAQFLLNPDSSARAI